MLLNEKRTDFLILLLTIVFILLYSSPQYLVADTVTAGGDTISHNYAAKFMKESLLPKGKLVGWSQGWFAGFPMFQFYFPFPYLLIAILSFAVPFNIAFKFITIAGILLLPVSVYLLFKLMRFEWPTSIVAAIFSLATIMNTSQVMWGNNYASTLAGEFANTISLCIALVFLGLLYQSVKKNKNLLKNSVLLFLIGINHVYPLIIAVLTSFFFTLKKHYAFKNLKYLLKMHSLAFLLLAFWAIPFVSKIQYTAPFNFIWKFKNAEEIFPPLLWPFIALSIVGVLFALKNNEERINYLVFATAVSTVLYFLASKILLIDVRFLSFIQLFIPLIAAYGLVEVLRNLKFFEWKTVKETSWLFPLTVFLIVGVFISSFDSVIPTWTKWNYEGLENKRSWSVIKELSGFVKELPGNERVAYEHSKEHTSLGSIKFFELLPFLSNKPTLEGLYFQSSVSSPYIFYLQSEYSERGSCPITGYKCTKVNIKRAKEHLKIFNVRYFIAVSDKIKRKLEDDAEFKLLKTIEKYEIFEFLANDDHYVTVPKNIEFFQSNDLNAWKKASYEWFSKGDLETVLVFGEEIDYSAKRDCEIKEQIENEEIFFKTNCIYAPHLVRVSYFPNWRVEGAKKIYLASPSFMLVFPEQNKVRIYYSNTLEDTVGMMLTAFGVLVLVGGTLKWMFRL